MHKQLNNLAAEVIKEFTTKERKLAMMIAGNGVGIMELFNVPGASAVMLGSDHLYSRESWLNRLSWTDDRARRNGGYVSFAAASALARKCSAQYGVDIIGLGSTSALATNRHRRGEDHGFLEVGTWEKRGYSGDWYQSVLTKEIHPYGTCRQTQDMSYSMTVLQLLLDWAKKQ